MNAQPRRLSSRRFFRTSFVAILVGSSLFSACGGAGGSNSTGIPGQPGGGSSPFIVDPNESGQTTDLRLIESFWGSLVDIYDLDSDGNVSPLPVYRDFVIRENLFPDGANYDLETNPVTQQTRLIVRRSRADDTEAFNSLVRSASEPLSPITPRNDNGTSAPPFSFIARNSTLVLRFNDVLNDDFEALRNLSQTVRIKTGYPPVTPFSGRVFFDRNHGAAIAGVFHSTRVLIDLTVSEAEAAGSQLSIPLNSIGLPSSLENSALPNVSIRIPTLTDFGSGQFHILQALSGAPLTADVGEPTDPLSSTMDVVRAMRSGNAQDVNGGFVLDLNQPQVVGSWPLQVVGAEKDDTGLEGFDFVLDVHFLTVCQSAAQPGDVIQTGDEIFLEVQSISPPPNGLGDIAGVRARFIGERPLASENELLASGLFLSTFSSSVPIPRGCWVNFSPQPLSYPSTRVSTDAQVQIRFSEPMDPETLTPFETFQIVSGDVSVPANSSNIVVGSVSASDDLRIFTNNPLLRYRHQPDTDDSYSVRIQGATDLSGNPLLVELPRVDFRLNAELPPVVNSSVVMRFNSTDEVAPFKLQDLRGQLFYNLTKGVITPRPVAITNVPADRSNPIPSIMVPFPPGVQTPLSPLGSKLQALWRYCDLGWQVQDETRFNVDVLGINWAPIGGQIVADFFEQFEIALCHSRRQPDEEVDTNLLPRYQNSGLRGKNNFFTDNILNDPLSPQVVVHPRDFGYRVDPINLFLSNTGVTMLPFPLNQDPALDPVTYTWRDTAVLSKAAPSGVGIPLAREVGPPLSLEDAPPGRVAGANNVPSFGLPLLIEYRTFPSNQGFGLNALDISLAINSSAIPAFRAYSTGGFDVNSTIIRVEPDLEDQPKGGFNPGSNPPGRRTRRADDNSFYIGQLDIITRISRVHSAWIDTQFQKAEFYPPVILPEGSSQPLGTEIVIEYRGANTFFLNDGDDEFAPFDARQINAYGEMFAQNAGVISSVGEVDFVGTDGTWTDDINVIDASRFLQMRISFFNNIQTGLSPELSGIGIAFEPLP